MPHSPKIRLLAKLYLAGITAGVATLVFITESSGYRFEWEGLYSDKNFRDVGQSINDCIMTSGHHEMKVLRENLLFRSNRLFSGHSCTSVGNPEEIISLNYKPFRKFKYFCVQNDHEPLIGFVPGNITRELADLEFRKTWFDEEMRIPACEALQETMKSLTEDRRVLIHCDAGRDRTGAFSGIIAGLALEEIFQRDILEPILECDYRKTKSLYPKKFGRIAAFFSDTVSSDGSLANFILNRCPNISRELIDEVKKSLVVE